MTKREYTTHLGVWYTSTHNLIWTILEEIRIIKYKLLHLHQKFSLVLRTPMFVDLACGKVISNVYILGAIRKSKKFLITKNVNKRHMVQQIFHHKLGQMVRYHILYSVLVLDSNIKFLE